MWFIPILHVSPLFSFCVQKGISIIFEHHIRNKEYMRNEDTWRERWSFLTGFQWAQVSHHSGHAYHAVWPTNPMLAWSNRQGILKYRIIHSLDLLLVDLPADFFLPSLHIYQFYMTIFKDQQMLTYFSLSCQFIQRDFMSPERS